MKTSPTTAMNDEHIVTKIHVLRNQKIILDKDLASLYGVTAKRLREQVRRNNDRFPENFMFQLTENEILMVPQNAAPSMKFFGGHLPYAFTEHGVLMAANVLKTTSAVQMSIRLIEIFIKLREMLAGHKEILLRLENLEMKLTGHDTDIRMILAAIKQLVAQPSQQRVRIGYRRKDEKD